MANDETSQKVQVHAGQTATACFTGASTRACRVDGTIYFDTAKSFIYPRFRPALEQAFAFGLSRSPSGSGPIPATGRFLLIVGHTDQVGSQSANQMLSERRARAALAVFTHDADAWESLCQTERWLQSTVEIETMSAEVDIGGDSNLIQRYKTDRTARLDLIWRYLESLRPSWLPQQSPPITPAMVSMPPLLDPILGCSFDHPRRNAPGTGVEENRRVEFFYFRQADPGERQCPNQATYRSWQSTCGQQINVQIEIKNEYNEPYIGTFDLTLPSGGNLNSERTDATGKWQRENMPPGLYGVRVGGHEITELPAGRISAPLFDKRLDAQNNQIKIQVIDLDRWFIPQQHADIPRFTRGNIVDPLIDGEAAFRAMHNAFSATGEEGYIYITGWDMVPDIHLLARSGGTASQLQNVLGGARGRGVDVRILLWYGNAIQVPGHPHRGGLGQAVWEAFPWAQIFTDNKTRGLVGSHHQKTAAVRTREELVSFVGGIDLTADRWDTSMHAFPNPDADYEMTGGQPWHDVHARVRGPVAADIETNFRQRWNDTNRLPGFPGPTPPVPRHAAPPALSNGSQIVQTLRTFPHHATAANTNWHYDFAPAGELGLRQAYRRAINCAREYIYIEDQYLISDREISVLIASAMRRSAQLQVVLLTAPEPDMPVRAFNDAFDFHQNAFVTNLRAVDPTRVEIFHLVNAGGRGIYCHSKVCIVDDIWAIISSCNMSTRSLTHDSEIGVAVVDGALEGGRRKFARDLRKALWAEHLGLAPNDIPDDPIAGAALWRGRAGSPPAHAVVHRRPAGSDHWLWNTSLDPDGAIP